MIAIAPVAPLRKSSFPMVAAAIASWFEMALPGTIADTRPTEHSKPSKKKPEITAWTVARSPSCAALGFPAGTPGHDGPPLRQALDGAAFTTTRVQGIGGHGVPLPNFHAIQLQACSDLKRRRREAVLAVPNCELGLRS